MHSRNRKTIASVRPPPALFEVKVAAPRRMFPTWVVGLAILLGVNVVALGWVLLRDSGRSGCRPRRRHGAHRAPAAPGAPPGMVTVPATVTIPHHREHPDQRGAEHNHGRRRHSGTVNGTQYIEEPVLSGNETPVPPDYNANDYAPAITPAEAGAVAAARRAGGVPSRDELLAQGMQIPELRLDLHVYAVNPRNDSCSSTCAAAEGDSLPDGVRVETITRGAHLSYRGSRFSIDGN